MRYKYILLLIGFCLLSGFSLSAQEISVDGVAITKENSGDVLAGQGAGKAGCVSFDADNHILRLNNARLDMGIKALALDAELTIRIEGACHITADPFALYTDSYVTVTGEGSLTVRCPSGRTGGFAMDSEKAVLRFKECTVSVETEEGAFAVASLKRGRGLLVFDHADWTSVGLVGAMNRISIKRADIKQPVGGRVGNKYPEDDLPFANIIDGEQRPNYGTFRLQPNNKYPLRIDDVDVTTENAANVFPNSVVPDGYVHYYSETNRLVVSNLDFFNMNVPNIENFHDETDLPLTLEVRGVCDVWSVYNSIYSRGPLIITGPGVLKLKTEDLQLGAAAITMDDRQTLTIKNVNLITTGFFAIAGLKENSARLVIEDAYVEMHCTRPKNGGACLLGFQSMDLINVSVKEPSGAYFSPSAYGIVGTNGALVTDKVIIGNDQWNGSTEAPLIAGDYAPIIDCRGQQLTIDLSEQPSPAPARIYDSKGMCLRCVPAGMKETHTLPSGGYIVVVGDYTRKVLIP